MTIFKQLRLVCLIVLGLGWTTTLSFGAVVVQRSTIDAVTNGYDMAGAFNQSYDETPRPVWNENQLKMADEGTFFGSTAQFNAAKAAPITNPSRLLTAGTDVPNAGGVIRSFAQEGDQIYYRVFSGSQQGRFLTAVPPSSSAFAREALALPSGNQATFIQQVLVPSGTILQRSRALPAFGARGGAEQFELLQRIPTGNFGPGTALP